MRFVTAGESHGRVLSVIISGVPAGVPVTPDAIDVDLARRQIGYGRGGRMRIEQDRALITSGVRFGETIGTPLAVTIANRDWDNWTDVMSIDGERPADSRVTAPRPGHADLAGIQKTGSRDVRDVLERASARETACRVAAGAVAKALLASLGVDVHSLVTRIGDAAWDPPADISRADMAAVEDSDVRCPDAEAASSMRAAIDEAGAAGESLGGVFMVVATGLLPGLGTYAEASRRLDAQLAAAVISIPAIKGVQFGDAFSAAGHRGSEVHDEIVYSEDGGYSRATNRAGGLEGGMTNGEALVVSAAMKPIPTLMTPLASVDIDTHDVVDASKERSDVCAVPAAAVVAEAEVAVVLARAYCDKFGGDALEDIKAAEKAYRSRMNK
jgi:chorismate synthase